MFPLGIGLAFVVGHSGAFGSCFAVILFACGLVLELFCSVDFTFSLLLLI